MKKIAVIETGGKQYLVSQGDELKIDVGQDKKKLEFDKVLLLVDGDRVHLGRPYLEKVIVRGENLKLVKDKKVRVAKFRAKSRFRRATGQRAQKFLVRITKIELSSKSASV